MTSEDYGRICLLLCKGIMLEQGISAGTIKVLEGARNTFGKPPEELGELISKLDKEVLPNIEKSLTEIANENFPKKFSG